MSRCVACALLSLALLTASCTRDRRARSAIETGDLDEARQLLTKQLEKQPDDDEAKMLLADVDLREGKVAAAKIRLGPLETHADAKWKISQMFRETVHRLAKSGDADAMGTAASETVRLNPLAASDMCDAVMERAGRERGKKWHALTDAAVAIGDDCRRKAIALMQSWLDDYAVENANVQDTMNLAFALRDLQPDDSLRIARSVRAAARKLAAEDRFKADELSKHLAEIDAKILKEPETAFLQKNVGPIEVHADVGQEDALSRVEETKRTLSFIGDLLQQYHEQNHRYPVVFSMDRLLTELHASPGADPYDAWGQPIHYASNGSKARLISPGSDREFAPVSSNLNFVVDKPYAPGIDIIWENGVIVQPPR